MTRRGGHYDLEARLRFLLLTVVAAATIGLAAGNAGAQSLRVPHKPWNKMTHHQKVVTLRKQIRHDRSILRFWRHHRYLTVIPNATAITAKKQIHWAHVSLRIASRNLHHLLATHHAVGGSDMGAWMCIHSYEGAWNDPNAPYWGGLQMDMGFQTTYGPEFYRRWGTADHWPVWAQITAARRARDGFGRYGARGYGPWPNTAHSCGLL